MVEIMADLKAANYDPAKFEVSLRMFLVLLAFLLVFPYFRFANC